VPIGSCISIRSAPKTCQAEGQRVTRRIASLQAQSIQDPVGSTLPSRLTLLVLDEWQAIFPLLAEWRIVVVVDRCADARFRPNPRAKLPGS
jgi:hypothetical protein